jgi:hypothetical protein
MSACAPTAKSQNVAFDDSQIASIPIECVEGFQISDCWWVTGKPEVILPVPVKLGATIHLSNHALKSAKPILREHLLFKHWCPSLTILVCQKPSVFSPIWISHDCAQWLQSALFCTVHAQQKKQLKYEFRKSLKVKKIGGRGRVRTGDPLLAKQVLSQLSYTPTVGTTLILKHFSRFQNPFLRILGVPHFCFILLRCFDQRPSRNSFVCWVIWSRMRTSTSPFASQVYSSSINSSCGGA